LKKRHRYEVQMSVT